MFAKFKFVNPFQASLAVRDAWLFAMPRPDDEDHSVNAEHGRDAYGTYAQWYDWAGASCFARLSAGYAAYTTCGGNVYRIDRLSNSLEFEGSRRSFEHGCLLGNVHKDGDGRIWWNGFEVRLVEWSTTVPGNPSPFEAWERVLAEHEELNAPPNVGELTEAQLMGWRSVLA